MATTNIKARYARAVHSGDWACKRCGGVDRYASGDCRECAIRRTKAHSEKNKALIAEKRSAYRAANKEKIRAQKAESYKRNVAHAKVKGRERYEAKKKEILARNAEWRRANPERFRSYRAKWERAHPEYANIHTHNYRSRKRAGGGRLTRGLVGRLLKLQKGLCPCCRLPLGSDFQLDHKMPLALGGQNVDANMQLLRATCNSSKGAKHPVDFMQSRGFLL